MYTIFLNIVARPIYEETLNPKQYIFKKAIFYYTWKEELIWGF
jgi:hypothetical protein